jgi:sugar lactone lactonase YvrE
MANPVARLICDAGAAIGESPLWLDGRVLWTDPVERRLLRFSDTDGFDRIAVEQALWSLAALPEGVVVGTLDASFCAVAPRGAATAGLTATLDPGCRFNDMTVDAAGGLWAGAMHRGLLATRGAIFHAPSLDEVPRRVASGLGVPNGMKFANDGSTLYVVDTLARTLLAYPVHEGSLGEPVIVTDFLGLPGKPDGMAIGSDGSLWVAMWGGGSVVQIGPDGVTLREVRIPAPHVSSLSFAGPDRLLVTTSRFRLNPHAPGEGSGGLFEIAV